MINSHYHHCCVMGVNLATLPLRALYNERLMSETCHVVLTYCSLHLCRFSGVNSSVAVLEVGKKPRWGPSCFCDIRAVVCKVFINPFIQSYLCRLPVSHFDMFNEISIFVEQLLKAAARCRSFHSSAAAWRSYLDFMIVKVVVEKVCFLIGEVFLVPGWRPF